MTRFSSVLAPAAVVAVALTLSSGCATKKFVRNTVTPVDERVGEVDAKVDTKTAANADRIESVEGQLNKDVSRLDERTKANSEETQEAKAQAEKAQRRADDAHDMAATSTERTVTLERKFADMRKYRLTLTESVLFDLGKSSLTSEASAKLDGLSKTLAASKDYVIEVHGFTDKTGSADLNLRLSQSRAEEVVRYLSGEHGVPLRSIHRVGLGDAQPTADNNSRDGRKQNRRVEVSVYVPVVSGEMQAQR
jgi:outer membrane protein OmpA-like peptidoglycan-associated protein